MKTLHFVLLVAAALIFAACGSSKPNVSVSVKLPKDSLEDSNPTAGIVGKPNDPDPLKIGDFPTPPVKPQASPSLVVGNILLPEDKKRKFDLKAPSNLQSADRNSINMTAHIPPVYPVDGDWSVIMGPQGAALTVWALAQGNWIWGYTLIDSVGFGGARIWRFKFFDNDEVMVENAETRTCLNGYKNGLIHMKCNVKNRYQRFKMIPMSNGAFQLKNIGLGTCVQAPINDIFGGFHRVSSIFLTRCASGSNLDQQWYIAPPTFLVRPLYRRAAGGR